MSTRLAASRARTPSPEQPRERLAAGHAPGDQFLYPGHILFAEHPARIRTILGSCVAAAIWDVRTKSGALNHFLLPWCAESSPTASARYGNIAMDRLLEEFRRRGSRTRDLRAHVFGGATVLAGFAAHRGDLGRRNIDMAISSLERHRVPIVSRDVGGSRGRRVVFETATGTTHVVTL